MFLLFLFIRQLKNINMKRFAIIVAGGTGRRMNADIPKQFMLLHNKPVLMHSLQKFYECNAAVVIVLHSDLINEWKHLCEKYKCSIPHIIQQGGDTRSQSVINGLNSIDAAEGVVAIHDAARPLISKQLIETLFTTACEKGNAIPFLNIAESMRKITGSESEPVNREAYVTVQTPQCFLLKQIKDAYSKTTQLNFTDDATLFEAFGHQINLIEGERSNFKITVPEDLLLANALL